MRRKLVEITNENPGFDIIATTKKIGVNALNSVEISSQEAAWFLLLIKSIMESIRFTDADGYCNTYLACASTGKAAVSIGGTTVHTAFKITLLNFLTPLSNEVKSLYRSFFKYVKMILIDGISMIEIEMFERIDLRFCFWWITYNSHW